MWHRREPTPLPGLAIVRVTGGKGYLVSCAHNSGKTGDEGRAERDPVFKGLRVGIRGVTLAES